MQALSEVVYIQSQMSCRLGDAWMSQQIKTSLVQVMAWHRIGAKPLPEPMMTSCQSYHRNLKWVRKLFFHRNLAKIYCLENVNDFYQYINSLRPDDTYVKRFALSFVHRMDGSLPVTPSHKINHCYLIYIYRYKMDSKEPISMKFESKYKTFHSRKCI